MFWVIVMFSKLHNRIVCMQLCWNHTVAVSLLIKAILKKWDAYSVNVIDGSRAQIMFDKCADHTIHDELGLSTPTFMIVFVSW